MKVKIYFMYLHIVIFHVDYSDIYALFSLGRL
jgi:hypothetical protein